MWARASEWGEIPDLATIKIESGEASESRRSGAGVTGTSTDQADGVMIHGLVGTGTGHDAASGS